MELIGIWDNLFITNDGSKQDKPGKLQVGLRSRTQIMVPACSVLLIINNETHFHFRKIIALGFTKTY